MESVQRLVLQIMASQITSQFYLEILLFVVMTLLSLVYGLIFYFRQRRESHVRTGSLKEKSSSPQYTSPHLGRKVGLSYDAVTKLEKTDIVVSDWVQLEPSCAATDAD